MKEMPKRPPEKPLTPEEQKRLDALFPLAEDEPEEMEEDEIEATFLRKKPS